MPPRSLPADDRGFPEFSDFAGIAIVSASTSNRRVRSWRRNVSCAPRLSHTLAMADTRRKRRRTCPSSASRSPIGSHSAEGRTEQRCPIGFHLRNSIRSAMAITRETRGGSFPTSKSAISPLFRTLPFYVALAYLSLRTRGESNRLRHAWRLNRWRRKAKRESLGY
jgi:hypothetical protein